MPLKVPCPSCRGILTIGEELQGKNVRCPRCKTVFKAPAEPVPAAPPAPIAATPAAPPEEEVPGWMSEALAQQREEEIEEQQEEEQDEEQEEQEQLDKNERRGWKTVRTGILCELFATLIASVAAITAAYFLMEGKEHVATAASLLLIGNVVSGLLSILGKGLCLAVPRQGGGKVLAALATALVLLSVGIWAYLTQYSLEEPGPGQQLPAETLRWIYYGYFIVTVLAMFCWLLFLYHVCWYFCAQGPSIAVVIFGLLGGVWAVFVVGTLYGAQPGDLRGQDGGPPAELLGMVGGLLALLVFYVCLLAVIAGVVGRKIAKR